MNPFRWFVYRRGIFGFWEGFSGMTTCKLWRFLNPSTNRDSSNSQYPSSSLSEVRPPYHPYPIVRVQSKARNLSPVVVVSWGTLISLRPSRGFVNMDTSPMSLSHTYATISFGYFYQSLVLTCPWVPVYNTRTSRLRHNQVQIPPPPSSVVGRSNGPLSSSYQAYHLSTLALGFDLWPTAIVRSQQRSDSSTCFSTSLRLTSGTSTTAVWYMAECEQQMLASSRRWLAAERCICL